MKCWRLLVLSLFLSSVLAQSLDPGLSEGLRLLEEARTTLDSGSLTEVRDHFLQLTQKNGGNALYFYQLARVNSYLIDAQLGHHDKRSADRALDDAFAAVQHALSLNDQSADAHSLLADLYGRKISLGAFMAGPRYGPKVDAENKKALALDAKAPRVYASLGRQYLFAPKMFGGDIDKAIDSFREATRLDSMNDENFVWLGIAYRKKGDTQDADKAFQQALRLNPRSTFAIQKQSEK
jgi:tetratricopeptide (TPR) repeat protein